MSELQTLITGNVYVFLLVFTRVGTALMMMPGVGETFVSERIRLFFAIGFTLVLTPVILPLIDKMPGSPFNLMILLVGEVLIGGFMGLVARALLSIVNTAGMIVAMQMSLANASVFNPQVSSQTSITSSMYSMIAVLMMFATNMHHMFIKSIVHSYELFPVGGKTPIHDMALSFAEVVNEGFVVAVEFSAPFFVIGFALHTALGVVARLVPQIQIFFIGVPIQIILGMMALMATMSACMMFFLERFTEIYGNLFG